VNDRRRRLLVPVVRAQTAQPLLVVADAMLRLEGGGGQVLGVVEASRDRLASSLTVVRRYRELLRRLTAVGRDHKMPLGVVVRVAPSVCEGIRDTVAQSAADLVIMEWPGVGRSRQTLLGSVLSDLVRTPPADLLLVRSDPERDSAEPVASVLVPVRGGLSARLALRAARALALAHEAVLTVLHVYEPRQEGRRRRTESDEFHRLVDSLPSERVKVLEVESANPGKAILEEASRHQVVVLGAHANVGRTGVLVESALAKTVRRLPGTVILARSGPVAVPDDIETPPRRLSVEPDASSVVDRWFAENTFHSREFADIQALVDLKRQQGQTISLGLPTLNESATIGKLIRVLKEELLDRHTLLDEIVVVDSGSTDGTVEIARGLGVRVVQHPEILPHLGSYRGKGEALWKSLYELDGDIVVWCDTDISNIHPQFVYGVVGPLLTDSRIGYVKGFYRRPLNFGGVLQTAGGGRVTELAARPMLNLFYPELSGLLQPLSGEYAGRRELLERLPFFSGYGVEIGHLIDVLESFGLNRIAQVDLGLRIHRNQELFDLSKMAFAIMQVAFRRLGDRHRIHLVEEVNRSMKLIHYTKDRFVLEDAEIGDWERPPMARVPEYLARRHRLVTPAGA
jgi:nucleotide-binding universal stress UspA family protein